MNPDVFLRPRTSPGHRRRPYLVLKPHRLRPADSRSPLDQYGMEYNPIAINEVLAYSFLRRQRCHEQRRPVLHRAGQHADRPQTAIPRARTQQRQLLDLERVPVHQRGDPPKTPWDVACWDIIFTDDDPISRPTRSRASSADRRAPGSYGSLPLQPGSRSTRDRPRYPRSIRCRRRLHQDRRQTSPAPITSSRSATTVARQCQRAIRRSRPR